MSEDDEKMTEKQIRIIDAAVESFAQKGYSATSTSEIAKRAGVAEGTIFRHYKTKKELFLSIVTPVIAKFVAPFVLRDFYQLFEEQYESFPDFLRAVLRNRLTFVMKNGPVIKILLHEIPFHEELRQQFKEQVFPQVAGPIERIIVHFQERGELIDLAPSTLIRLSISVMAGYIITRCYILPDNAWDDEKEVELAVQFIMHGLSPT